MCRALQPAAMDRYASAPGSAPAPPVRLPAGRSRSTGPPHGRDAVRRLTARSGRPGPRLDSGSGWRLLERASNTTGAIVDAVAEPLARYDGAGSRLLARGRLRAAWRQRPGNTKACPCAPDRGGLTSSVRRAEVIITVPPAPAAYRIAEAPPVDPRAPIHRQVGEEPPPAILYPLEDVAHHVMHAKRVCPVAPDRRRSSMAVVTSHPPPRDPRAAIRPVRMLALRSSEIVGSVYASAERLHMLIPCGKPIILLHKQ